MKRLIEALAIGVLASAAGPAGAASIVAVTPQGEVAQVRQVTVKFSEAVVAFGDPRLADPVAIACRGRRSRRQRPLGQRPRLAVRLPRAARPRRELHRDGPRRLAAGVEGGRRERRRCRREQPGADRDDALFVFHRRPGRRLDAAGRRRRDRGGPAFRARLNGAAVEASVVANAWCEVEGIGERIALKIVGGDCARSC